MPEGQPLRWGIPAHPAIVDPPPPEVERQVGWERGSLHLRPEEERPGLAHPCAKAGKALDAAGYEYEIKTVGGYRLAPWTWVRRGGDREEIKRLSGTNEVPILVLDDGEVVSGSGAIARWAKEHPRSPAKPGG